MQAANFSETLEQRQGLNMTSIEEIAYRMGDVDTSLVKNPASPLVRNAYGLYLMNILKYQDMLS